MNRIVIIQFWSYYLSGNVFYLEELAQYLEQEKNLDVYVYNICQTQNRNKLLERYSYITKETNHIQKNDIIYTTFNGMIEIFRKQPNIIELASKIVIISNASIMEKIKDNIKEFVLHCMEHSHKFYLLIDPLYYNGSERLKIFQNRIIHYQRGFYFKNYVETKQSNSKYLLYYTKVDIYDIQPYMDKIEQYCQKNNIEYLFGDDDIFQSYHVANIYAGLFYTRKKDYTPRLPYEFWYYNKPVVFFDRSDGLLKRYTEEQLSLEQKVIHTNIPILQMDDGLV